MSQKKPCLFHKQGNCTNGSSCPFSHQDCRFDNNCTNDKCGYRHPTRLTQQASTNTQQQQLGLPQLPQAPLSVRIQVGANVSGSNDNNKSALPCQYYKLNSCTKGSNCSFLHQDCRYDNECTNDKCGYRHPSRLAQNLQAPNTNLQYDANDGDGVDTDDQVGVMNGLTSFEDSNDCINGIDCNDYDCDKEHPKLRKNKCFRGATCWNVECRFLHPNNRSVCEEGENCTNFLCKKLHPQYRVPPCKRGEYCVNYECNSLHPDVRLKVCDDGEACFAFSCAKLHPSNRTKQCSKEASCADTSCELLHPEGWDPESRNRQNSRASLLKSNEQRDRTRAQLPILGSRQEFCQRLARDKVVVVIAETGSGKTTQLPQYCADDPVLGTRLVVCTQPRVMAAISISKRIAEEYDGADVGESVGYSVGANNARQGRKILLMTDAVLIRALRDDPDLNNYSVLMIDEAHERSLNTDIVLGVAKRILAKRRDFYVVIASATIDPKPFLDFFGIHNKPLSVPGRIFGVSLDHKPPKDAIRFQPRLIQDHVVPTVIDVLKAYPKGHALVFLAGQAEIETAIKLFEKDGPDNCTALPLYGSLPPEKQEMIFKFDDDGETQRMVVFCTNVAETSLTVPGVKLVIDSGLAKEARFDVRRRMTVLELVRVSLSSANQRKGRAGRLSEGHCVRLYDEAELTRATVEPEILRSSLDSVVLQMLRAAIDPRKFDFLSRPDTNAIEVSFSMLQRMECINAQGAITEKGKLFSEISFEPRVTQFVVIAHQKHNLLDLASGIASIISAPGSIFFLGGDKDTKREAKEKIAEGASKFDSDLFYQYHILNLWKCSGSRSEGSKQCASCHRICFGTGCRACRVKFAVVEGLNNKVLDCVLATQQQVTQTITGFKRNGSLNSSATSSKGFGERELIAIAECLKQAFPEQIGYLLVPTHPDEGTCLPSADVRAQLSATSVMAQKSHSDPRYHAFIALSITQLPSGIFFIDRLHPLMSQPDNHAPMSVVFESRNCGPEIAKRLRNFIFDAQTELRKIDDTSVDVQWSKWAVLTYEASNSHLQVHASVKTATIVRESCTIKFNEIRQGLLDYEHEFFLPGGLASVKLVGGLKVKEFIFVDKPNRLVLRNIDTQGLERLEWISKHLEIKISDRSIVKWWSMRPMMRQDSTNADDGDNSRRQQLVIVFQNEADARKALKVAQAKFKSLVFNGDAESDKQQEDQDMSLEVDSVGRELKLESQTAHLAENVVVALCKDLAGVTPQHVKYMGGRPSSQIVFGNWPLANQSHLRNLLLGLGAPNGSFNVSFAPKKISTQVSSIAFVAFLSSDIRDETFNKLSDLSGARLCPGSQEGKYATQVKGKQEGPGNCKYHVVLKNQSDAETMYSKASSFANAGCTVDGTGRVLVKYADKYPLVDYIQTLNQRFPGVSVTKDKKQDGLFFFSGASPRTIAACLHAFKAVLTPLKQTFGETTPELRALYRELISTGKFRAWCDELGLFGKVDKLGNSVRVWLWGPHVKQGAMMRKVGEYWDSFQHRFAIISIPSRVCGLLKQNKFGGKALRDIESQHEHAHINLLLTQQLLEVYVAPNSRPGLINEIKNKIQGCISDISPQDFSSTSKQTQCASCGESNKLTCKLIICGHSVCTNCISNLTLQNQNQLFECPDRNCKTPIAVQQIKGVIDNQKFDNLCLRNISSHLRLFPSFAPIRSCPREGCPMFVEYTKSAYTKCPECHFLVCFGCGAVDEPLHEGRSCESFREHKARMKEASTKNSVTNVLQAAKTFAETEWSIDMGKMIDFQPSPCLDISNPCRCLQRFLAGLSQLKPEQTDSELLNHCQFAWHGTDRKAIFPICHDGFDTQRRAGQACGPGEYFGVAPSVSLGYCKGGNQMMVCLLIKLGITNFVPRFCYVVNNPSSDLYSIPIGIVTFAPTNSSSVSTAIDGIAHPGKKATGFFLAHVEPQVQPADPRIELLNLSAACTSSWIAPFRWMWGKDDGTYEPYTDIVNTLIERNFEEYKLNRGPSSFTTPHIIRYVDDIPQQYLINFGNNTQTNCKTSYLRRVKREKVEIQLPVVRWEVQDNSSARWIEYEQMVRANMLIAYNSYCAGTGPSKWSFNFPGRPELYEIDFVAGIQTNMVSKTTRPIRKI